MSVIAVARRYAEALADVAISRNQVDQIDAEVGAFARLMAESRELHDLFASPIVSQSDKGHVLEAIIERARPGQMTANLLRTLLRHYRLHNLAAVYEQFQREINERRGMVLAEVTTAAPVGRAEQDALSARLREMTGKQVQLQFRTDPGLIGGVVTRIGSVVYDGSIRTQLRAVRQRLKQESSRSL
ncbi:MAG TPA: ATP synthase F1 subunit delta [Blastocatellia bacterium]|nr:ATP synthase F1 subunit delta [Blastocatellia bacterium]